MSDSKDGPALMAGIREIQGHFPTDSAMQDALGRLTLAGYDRADFSLPDDQAGSMPTPNETAENPVDATDKAQLRTMGASMAGYAGAAAAAGITLATGGAAGVAVAAAAAIGAGSGLAANAAGNAADDANVADRNARGAAGTLILAVRVVSDEQSDEVTRIMEAAGASSVEQLAEQAKTAGVSSASWTGA